MSEEQQLPDEASIGELALSNAAGLNALVDLLIEKGIIDEIDYQNAVEAAFDEIMEDEE